MAPSWTAGTGTDTIAPDQPGQPGQHRHRWPGDAAPADGTPQPPPVLVFGWGNPARGDDALGPLAVEAVEALNRPDVECLTDFQLQVEHALDLRGRRRVLFVDASYDAEAPFSVTPVQPHRDGSYTTHEMSPEAVLHVFTDVVGHTAPPTWLLAIRGEVWDLGAEPSEAALGHLDAALDWLGQWLDEEAGTPDADLGPTLPT